jgi:hypothetical protein
LGDVSLHAGAKYGADLGEVERSLEGDEALPNKGDVGNFGRNDRV